MTSAILRPKQAAEYIGICLRSLYNYSDSDPDFPPKIQFSPRCVGWRKEAIDAWLERKEREAA